MRNYIKVNLLNVFQVKFLYTLIILCTISTANAQGLRLNGYTSYVFDHSFDEFVNPNTFYEATIKGGFQWGGGLEYMAADYYGIELSYLRQDTDLPVTYWRFGEQNRTLDISVNYILLGGNRYFSSSERFEGYGGLMVGMVIYDNKSPLPDEPDSRTKLGIGGKLGANVWMTDKVGLKLQAQFLSTVQGFGGGFYLGTGGGGAGVSTYSTIYQFILGGGLVFKLQDE
ncbi:MAG: porin family protein [Cyclobacteriaceae bacterium]|nr:porin family protein [Cyclobacteriaceae bacterium]